jgi:hypothetical protein
MLLRTLLGAMSAVVIVAAVAAPARGPSVDAPSMAAAAVASGAASDAAPGSAGGGGAAAATAPPLDLDSLETRLKETPAIGLFTKLALKNQVDDLLERFRAVHEGRTKTRLADLRQPFNMLVTKVLALLQDGDPPLAQAVAASREPLWKLLSDPQKMNGSHRTEGDKS